MSPCKRTNSCHEVFLLAAFWVLVSCHNTTNSTSNATVPQTIGISVRGRAASDDLYPGTARQVSLSSNGNRSRIGENQRVVSDGYREPNLAILEQQVLQLGGDTVTDDKKRKNKDLEDQSNVCQDGCFIMVASSPKRLCECVTNTQYCEGSDRLSSDLCKVCERGKFPCIYGNA